MVRDAFAVAAVAGVGSSHVIPVFFKEAQRVARGVGLTALQCGQERAAGGVADPVAEVELQSIF